MNYLFRKLAQDLEIFTFVKPPQKVNFKAQILSAKPVTKDNRFGASMNLIHAFKDHLLRTKRNGQTIRGKWEIEWQSTDQSQKANAFLREIISYKVG